MKKIITLARVDGPLNSTHSISLGKSALRSTTIKLDQHVLSA